MGDQCPDCNDTYLENCISITSTIPQHGFRILECNFDIIPLDEKAAVALPVHIINMNNKTAAASVNVKAGRMKYTSSWPD